MTVSDMMEYMTCKQCRIPMNELKGHVYHGNRKFRCPKCNRAKMQKPKKKAWV